MCHLVPVAYASKAKRELAAISLNLCVTCCHIGCQSDKSGSRSSSTKVMVKRKKGGVVRRHGFTNSGGRTWPFAVLLYNVRFLGELRVSSKDFETFAKAANWYHALQLGEMTTTGRFPSGLQNRTLLGVFDMLGNLDPKGMTCLDIGTVDGIVAFGLAQRGAKKVVATDRIERETFLRLRERLNLRVSYHAGFEFPQIEERYRSERFDLIVCAGVIYHMLNPFSAFQACRKLVKTGGLLILETAADYRNPESATIAVNAEEQIFDESYTYFVPTPAAVRGMMRMAGFDVIDERFQRSLRRYSVVGRATSISEITSVTATLRAMLERGYVDYGFNLQDPQISGTSKVDFSYRRIDGNQEMTPEIEESVSFPFHPKKSTSKLIGKRHKWVPVKGSL